MCGGTHMSLYRGVLNIVIKLIDKQADVGATNSAGAQAIHRASAYGNAGVIKKLLE